MLDGEWSWEVEDVIFFTNSLKNVKRAKNEVLIHERRSESPDWCDWVPEKWGLKSETLKSMREDTGKGEAEEEETVTGKKEEKIEE